MKTLYLFRHAETSWNEIHKLQGRTDIHLSLTGIRQAKNARKMINNLNIDICYVSPLNRAIETTNIVLKDKNIPLIIHEGLVERDFGIYEGKVLNDYDELTELHDKVDFNGETNKGAAIRMKETLLDIVNNCEYDNILISTHGGLISGFIDLVYEENNSKERFNYKHLENCSINVVKYDEGIFIPTGEYIK